MADSNRENVWKSSRFFSLRASLTYQPNFEIPVQKLLQFFLNILMNHLLLFLFE